MRRPRLPLTIFLALATVLAMGSTVSADSHGHATTQEEGLKISSKSSEHIRGSYGQTNRPTVAFSSEALEGGGASVQRSDHPLYTRIVKTTITVDGQQITFKINPQKGTLVRNSSGAALSEKDTQALQSTLQGFVRNTDLENRRLTNERALLVRNLAYLAEAPAGYAIPDLHIRYRPATQTDGARQDPESSSSRTCAKRWVTTIESQSVSSMDNPDGGPNDNDGVSILHCDTQELTEWHDSQNHRFRPDVDAVGPDSGTLKGRCGNRTFINGWTRDCTDHDACVQFHDGPGVGANDPHCGDEWDWANEDFTLTAQCQCAQGGYVGYDCGPGDNLARKSTTADRSRNT